MTDEERTLCATTAAWLDAAGTLAAWGLALSAIAVAVLLAFDLPGIAGTAALYGVAALGLVERYLALRLRFDAGLFRALADGTVASPTTLDGALAHMALRPATTTPRTLQDRVHGTLKLLRAHRTAVLLQTVLALAALAWLAAPEAEMEMTTVDMTQGETSEWTNT